MVEPERADGPLSLALLELVRSAIGSICGLRVRSTSWPVRAWLAGEAGEDEFVMWANLRGDKLHLAYDPRAFGEEWHGLKWATGSFDLADPESMERFEGCVATLGGRLSSDRSGLSREGDIATDGSKCSGCGAATIEPVMMCGDCREAVEFDLSRL